MNKEIENKEIMSRIEAASYLNLCKASLDKLPIPKTRAGRRVIYRRSAIDLWLQKQESTQTVKSGRGKGVKNAKKA